MGQQYGGYVYDGVKWKVTTTSTAPASIGPTPPTSATNGDMWWNSTDGTQFMYYNDGSSAQWVESRSAIAANGYYSPNYLINGAFEINQRGFTSTTTTDAYGHDRWALATSGGCTYSTQAFTVGTALGGYEASNYARLVTTGQSASNTYSILSQKIEDVKTLAGKTITISFWAKAASGTPSIAIELEQYFGAGGSTTFLQYANKVSVSGSWARYSVTVTVPGISGKTITSSSYFRILFWVSAGADWNSRTGSIGIQSNTFDFWGVQVEEGSAATTFRRNANSIQGELAACQRYYQKYSSLGAYTPIAGSGFITGGTNARIHFVPSVPGRIAPTSVTLTNFGVYDTYSVIALSGAYGLVTPTPNYFALDATISGGTQYRPVFPYATGAGAGSVEFNMEM